ncbi:MAG: endonuclease III, partial [Bacteroidales bacterium]
MTLEERYKQVIDWFLANMPEARTELDFKDPYQLLVAVILSAQCTDKRVNTITPAFFKAFPDVEALAQSNTEEVFEYIRTCSYPNNKAKHLVGMAQTLCEQFGGKVPASMEELLGLPGVGRKTASVILICAFNKAAMPVDTHVFRVANRLGLTPGAKTPEQSEVLLMKHFPEHLLGLAHHWLILHGRYVCQARKPNCPDCGLTSCCQYF